MYFQSPIILFFVLVPLFISANESQFSINYNKAIQIVDEKFISFTVGPEIFFAGLSDKPIILKLMKNLTPAYLRIAGYSTQFLEFNQDEMKATRRMSDDSTSLTFSPAMWWSINEWIQRTNITPIFGINDEILTDGKWNTEAIMPLLDMTSKMNVNCLWQLGFDCSKKGFENYRDDLKTFRDMINKFPKKKSKWQIIGSDLSKCTPSDHPEILRMYLADLQEADAIIWDEEESASSRFLSGSVMHKLLAFHEASLPIWLSTPKTEHPITFEDSINWAIEMGEAAKSGFAVIFREPRLQEYYSATPAYWVTVLHKNLMGRNVLDVKKYSEAFVYAHCSRDQNSFAVRGAMTLMIVNNGTEPHKAALRLPTQTKSIEVRSYILSTKDNGMDTYLNGEKLNLDQEFKLLPKLRRAKVLTHLLLTVPAKSIGFFVLPGAKIPICIDNEDDTQLILEEIDKIQEVDFSESSRKAEGLFSRLNSPARVSVSLADLRRKFEQEFKMDSSLIPKMKLKSQAIANDEWKKQQLPKANMKIDIGQKKEGNVRVNEMMKFLDKAKMDVNKMEFKNLLKKEDEKKEDILGSSFTLGGKPKTKFDLDLSSDEILKILGDRAKAKLEKKMGFADLELEGFLDRALGRKARGINMELLEEKVHDQEKKTLFKKPKKIDKVIVSPNSGEIELPDMSKIIPGHSDKSSKIKSAISESSLFGNNKPKTKLELFGFEPLDISGLLSLLGQKHNTNTATKTNKPAARFDKKPDLYHNERDFERQMSEFEDEMNGHNSFFDQFGDLVSIQPKQRQDFPEIGDGWELDDEFMKNNEFIINDENKVQETIEKLERYFNQNGGHEDYFDPALDSIENFGTRFKRSLGLIKTINTLKQRQLKNRISQRLKKLSFHPGALKTNGLSPTRKKLFTREAINANNKINEYQKAFLRTRLALQSNPLSKAWGKSPFNLLKRQLRATELEKHSEVYNPKSNISGNIIKNYESKLNGKEWRPNDILTLPELHSIYEIHERKDQVSLDEIPKAINTRNTRHVDNDINSMENAIDDFLNTIEKDKSFIKPLLDNKSAEYTIVLPTREKLSLTQDEKGDTEIILHRDSGKMSSEKSKEVDEDRNQGDFNTCPATDLYPKEGGQNDAAATTTNANDGNIGWKSVDEAIRDEDGRDNDDVKEKRVDRSEYVQKIPAKEKKSKEGGNGSDGDDNNKYDKFGFVKKIVTGFSSLWKKLHSKVNAFFKQVER